jgi:GNAT superfamily N-acetyltransferase
MGMDIHVRRLEVNDNRASFRCGNIELDRFFQRYAGQNQFRHHIGTTYVAVLDQQVTGFVTVSMGELATENITRALRKRLPAYPLPILRIARLAVDLNFQNQGIGKLLLKAMLELALNLRDQVGCTGVVVDAKPESVDFYNQLGFSRIAAITGMLDDRPEPAPMWLPIKLIAKAAQE